MTTIDTYPDITQEVDETDAKVRLLETVYADYYDMFVRRARGRGSQDPEAAVQDTFVSALGALDRFEPRGGVNSFIGWLDTILANTVINHWRRDNRRSTDPASDMLAYDNRPDTDAQEAFEEVDRQAQRAMIASYLVDTLSSKRGQILMDVAEGKSYEEIAHERGLKLGTVQSNIGRAYTGLRNDSTFKAMLEQ